MEEPKSSTEEPTGFKTTINDVDQGESCLIKQYKLNVLSNVVATPLFDDVLRAKHQPIICQLNDVYLYMKISIHGTRKCTSMFNTMAVSISVDDLFVNSSAASFSITRLLQ